MTGRNEGIYGSSIVSVQGWSVGTWYRMRYGSRKSKWLHIWRFCSQRLYLIIIPLKQTFSLIYECSDHRARKLIWHCMLVWPHEWHAMALRSLSHVTRITYVGMKSSCRDSTAFTAEKSAIGRGCNAVEKLALARFLQCYVEYVSPWLRQFLTFKCGQCGIEMKQNNEVFKGSKLKQSPREVRRQKQWINSPVSSTSSMNSTFIKTAAKS